jgi:signal transduction histidine kinase
MYKLKFIFFPDPEYALMASLCYVLIFLTAYKRYNALIINYGSYDAPKTARPWTTWLRYHGSAVIYACVYAVFFATLYQLFHQHPVLVDAAKKLLAKDSALPSAIEGISEDIKLLSPVLSVVLLTWAAEKYRKTTAADRKIRYYFQQLGSIPGAVSLTIRKMKRYDLNLNPDECTGDLAEEVKGQITLTEFRNDPKALEYLYLRACHLFNTIERWGSISSEFYQFQNAYHQAFENIKTRFEKVKRNAQRYYQLKLKLAGDANLYAQITNPAAKTRFDSMYPKVLTELRKDLKNDLKDILENMYLFVACAVHSEGITAKKRSRLLQSFGFGFTGTEKSQGGDVDPNDMAILAVYLIFVIPLSALFAAFAGNENMVMIQSLTYVVWSAMALFVGIISVATPIMVKGFKDSSENAFWKAIRPKKGHAWCAYLISGFIAGAAGIVVIFLLHFLAPDKSELSALKSLVRTIPWGLVPLSISFILGYHLDRKSAHGKSTIILEALTTMAAGSLAAALASFINSRIIDRPEMLPRMIFAVISASLLGGIIGTLIPNRYRDRTVKSAKITRNEVDLKELVRDCLEKFADRAGNENIRITSRIAADIPLLKLDRAKISLALGGLLSNALEFTPSEGDVTIEAGVLGQGDIRVTIKDNGIGMSSYKVKTITDVPSETLHAAWQHTGEYQNANLLQVRSIVEKHGGKFQLASRQWEGTEATIELPKELACPRPSASEPEALLQGEFGTAAA